MDDGMDQLHETGIRLDGHHSVNSISLTRDYKGDEGSHDAVDSILAHASKLSNVKALVMSSKGKVLVESCDTPIEIDRDVYLTVKNMQKGDGDVGRSDICLWSNKLSASELLNHVNHLIDRHRKDRSNAIGSKICYFEHKPVRSKLDSRPIPGQTARDQRRMAVNNATPRLVFNMSQFHSNKKFSNLYGEQIEEIERRVKFFVNNREWYDARGIPYQLGMLYSNMSGCGKSSAIRAIANFTKRHIVNVNFSKILTLEQLNNLFFNEDIEVEDTKGNVQSLNIPIDRRLYVIEELDAVGDVVYQRQENNYVPVDGELTLAEILLVLDGNRESPGRMVIMTANHPELLDEALVRPGRMDVVVSFTHASQRLMREMYKGFFDKDAPEDIGEDCCGKLVKLTAAEVSQVYFRHLPNADDSVVKSDLVTTAVRKEKALQVSRKAIDAHKEKEKKKAEKHAGLTNIEEFKKMALLHTGDNHETIGTKPEHSAWTSQQPSATHRNHRSASSTLDSDSGFMPSSLLNIIR